jgi:two-component system, NtrC family, response regulator AtoC
MNTQNEYSVFLVDDDKMFLTSLKNSLKQQFGKTLRISEYTTGEECMERISQPQPDDNRPDIVILDYYLNDYKHPDAADGLKVMQELKSISDDIIIIMLSGQDKFQVAIDAIKNGAYEYIAKSESALIRTQNTIKNAIDSIKTTRENNKYLKWNYYMGIFIIAMILLDIIWYASNH